MEKLQATARTHDAVVGRLRDGSLKVRGDKQAAILRKSANLHAKVVRAQHNQMQALVVELAELLAKLKDHRAAWAARCGGGADVAACDALQPSAEEVNAAARGAEQLAKIVAQLRSCRKSMAQEMEVYATN